MSPRQAIMREVSALVGLGLALAGVAAGLVTLIVHLAWALPLTDIVTRPGTTLALGLALPGLVMRHLGRQGAALHRHGMRPRPLATASAGRGIGPL